MSLPVTAVIVNYRTPVLTRRAVWSLHSHYPELRVLVVENGSNDGSLPQLQALTGEIPTLTVLPVERNLHHGPGLDLGIRNGTANTDWVLVFDSDSLAFRKGWIERMLEPADASVYMIGEQIRVDAYGYPADAAATEGMLYIHPKCALVRRSTYLELPPFEKHGAPCLTNEIAATNNGYRILHFPVEDYVFHLGRGTVRKEGYRLGWRGPLNRIKRQLFS